MKTTLIFIFSMFVSNLLGQNLVPNFGFEEYVECPGSFSGNQDVHLAEPWIGFSADFLHECAGISDLSPEGDYAFPKSGDGYIRIASYLLSTYNFREYIEVQLNEPLEIGEYYCVEYYCNLYDVYGIGVDGMGAFFSEEFAEGDDIMFYDWPDGDPAPTKYILVEPQILSETIYDDTLNYQHVFGSFVADKEYNYVTIGNFVNDNKLNTNILTNDAVGASYAIDDVSVHKCGVSIEEQQLLPKVYPTFNQLHIKYLQENITVAVYDLSGRVVAEQNFNSNSVFDLSFLPTGMYVYQVLGKNGVQESGKLICG